MPHALLVDDDVNFVLGLAEVVGREGFTTKPAHTLKEARAEIARAMPDIVLVDLHLPDGTGLDLFRDLEASPSTEIVLITGQASVDTAVEAMRKGASDYLVKPVDLARVRAVLANVVRTRELKEQIGSLRGELRKLGRFGPLIGASPVMQRVYDMISKVAPTDATVMVLGETGTGKELMAETIHGLSRRHKEPFLPINCGAVSPTLIESELFGHERGSFTGADRRRVGYFEEANGGTLFLDEITEMSAELQVRLLRVLEEHTIRRVGGTQELKVDVRLLSATNRDPKDALEKGKIREDLYYRLNVFPLCLPSLKDRKEDIPVLAEHFRREIEAQEKAGVETFEPAALDLLQKHTWPGNVRELRNMVHRSYILTEKGTIPAATVRTLLPEKLGEECEPTKRASSGDVKKPARAKASPPRKTSRASGERARLRR